MLQREAAAAQCISQVHFFVHEQVVAQAQVQVVLLLFQHEHDVPRLGPGCLVALSGQYDAFAVLHPFFHAHVDHHVDAENFGSGTRDAAIVARYTEACTKKKIKQKPIEV